MIFYIERYVRCFGNLCFRFQLFSHHLVYFLFCFLQGVEDGYGGGPMRATVSEPSIGTTLLHVTGLGHVWATTGNLDEAHSHGKSGSSSAGMTSCHVKLKRRVNFLPTVRVVLIPSRMEYKDADMAPLLWWEDTDYSAFKKSAIRELKAVMEIQHLTSTKQALQVLYQPGFHIELDFDTSPPPPPIVVSTAPGNKTLNSTSISQEEGDEESNRCVSPPAPCLEDDFDQDQRSSSHPKMMPKASSAPDLMHAHTKIGTTKQYINLTFNFPYLILPSYFSHSFIYHSFSYSTTTTEIWFV